MTTFVTHCRACGLRYEPTACQRRKSDWLCISCRRTRDHEWRKRRRAAGQPVIANKTWDEQKREAWMERYYAAPEVRARRAAAMRKYSADPVLAARKRARLDVRNAVRRGSLKRVACEVCDTARSEAHHDDYEQPLAVRWLCRQHHRAHHRAARGAKADGQVPA